MKPGPSTSQPNGQRGRLVFLLGTRITPVFLVGSIVMALLAYRLLSTNIRWRHEEAVRCSAIVGAEFLRGRMPSTGPTEPQKADLEMASSRTGIFLVIRSGQTAIYTAGKALKEAPLAHAEPFTSLEGQEFLFESQTSRETLRQELTQWQRILVGFCALATAFGALLACGFAALVNRESGKLLRAASQIDQATAATSKASRFTEMGGLLQAMQGLHAFLAQRQTTLSEFDVLDFSAPAQASSAQVEAASWEVPGPGAEPFHLSAGVGGGAGVAPDQRQAVAVAAKLGAQLEQGPNPASLEKIAQEFPEVEAVVLDGVSRRKWRLRDGTVIVENWQPIGVVAPTNRAAADRFCERVAGLANPGKPVVLVQTLRGLMAGPAALVAVTGTPSGAV